MTDTSPPVTLRPATERDADFLADILLEAFNWTGEARFTREQLLADPKSAQYVADWPGPDDFGVIAEDPTTGERIGACWARPLPPETPGYGYVAPDVPELTLGVLPAHRRRGVGKALLDAVVAAAGERGLARLSLSVEDGNGVAALYRSRGFVPVGRDGDADTMVLDLKP
ncbi:GNAT family N-acetyltransferase [Streptomyces sp. 3MP-14]|uniref:GNAT family N-acetyltransferase n=1 Tax=Streptomyces mimosae TaxID=2586635 RepID=A0A5N6AQU6_9ACTN|nr:MULTISPECIES: N-acetyltransferase [Streptomyces]KAB8170984.1 GNAT family N-acetyltransferase [Streptomyces mimosae]KAB8179665.1 GNAT family N-acetyltransferase [Streptomyces sp. 3MP-14]